MHRDRLKFNAENCSIQQTLRIVGEKWTLLVLREAFYGVTRFDDFQRLVGCARNILSDRLGTLVDEGLLSREPYRDPGRRIRHEYRLTEKGLDLFPVLVALMQWGDRWLSGPEGPPVELSHRGCHAPIVTEVRCTAGHGPLRAQETRAEPGPGALLSSAS
jgi:DNA-binding HxlR family transcriptional regulator